MKKIFNYISLILFFVIISCSDLLEPEPIDLLTDDVVLNEPKDVPNVEIGLYSAFRPIIPAAVIAGDCTADMLIHNGTFTQYRELGTKQITSANASVATLWGSIYNTVYLANFIIERLPQVSGVTAAQRDKVLGTAHFLRGYAYFVALYSFGGVPKVTDIAIDVNRNIARASESEILDFILEDYTEALARVPSASSNAAFVNTNSVRAALAKYHLYLGNNVQAESFATNIIASNQYQLEANFVNLVTRDFTAEAIFEVGYTIADDPGTNGSIGLNNLFVGRRELIPSNQVIVALASVESGDRFTSIAFNSSNLKGSDNGWSVAKYGTADEDNNNVVVFRLAEMYLIRAEARTKQNNTTGARDDLNVLRTRAKAPLITSASQSQLIQLIEDERRFELAFEGHRWYDLVRTNRAKTVMSAFSSNWKDAYELWPIPQREILNNPALAGNQNPGY